MAKMLVFALKKTRPCLGLNLILLILLLLSNFAELFLVTWCNTSNQGQIVYTNMSYLCVPRPTKVGRWARHL